MTVQEGEGSAWADDDDFENVHLFNDTFTPVTAAVAWIGIKLFQEFFTTRMLVYVGTGTTKTEGENHSL